MKNNWFLSGPSLRVSSSNRNTATILMQLHTAFRDARPDFLPWICRKQAAPEPDKSMGVS